MVGKVGFAYQNQLEGGVALSGLWQGGGNGSANPTMSTLSVRPWSGEVWTWLNTYPLPGGSGFNANALGEIFVRALMSLCWRQHYDEIPVHRIWLSPMTKGGRMTVRLRKTKVWDVDVTYALVAEGLRKLFKLITQGFNGEIAGTIGLENDAAEIEVFAEVEVRVVTVEQSSRDREGGSDGVNAETY